MLYCSRFRFIVKGHFRILFKFFFGPRSTPRSPPRRFRIDTRRPSGARRGLPYASPQGSYSGRQDPFPQAGADAVAVGLGLRSQTRNLKSQRPTTKTLCSFQRTVPANVVFAVNRKAQDLNRTPRRFQAQNSPRNTFFCIPAIEPPGGRCVTPVIVYLYTSSAQEGSAAKSDETRALSVEARKRRSVKAFQRVQEALRRDPRPTSRRPSFARRIAARSPEST